METEETYVPPVAPQPLILTPEAQSYLLTAGKWATFLGILGFVFCGLFALFAISIGSIFAKLAEAMPFNPGLKMMAGFGGALTIFYLLIDLVYFFFALYIYQFATKIKAGINFSDSTHVTAGLGKLKSFFKLWGIVTIVIICLYIVAIAGFAVFAATMAKGLHDGL
ncbi:DUF5362 family protein [Mucilaginibacter sp. FT3.2]|uniref:DUF5362 family protein n=1 Tax=Mucilaginibacter sp. FT3.2 TaxID=2723090 RepID=UPI001609BFDD|nr:DUF5362 family protein [Mucilaginibacter sp. FT3.2]MBB6231959.1 putative membrane protein [Mucilaginibacter sp. FT3.2]